VKGRSTEGGRVSIGGGVCGGRTMCTSLYTNTSYTCVMGQGRGLTGLARFLVTNDRILSELEGGCERVSTYVRISDCVTCARGGLAYEPPDTQISSKHVLCSKLPTSSRYTNQTRIPLHCDKPSNKYPTTGSVQRS